jgi:hypothetical protein
MPHRSILADVLLPSARIVGKIQVPNSGLIGLMNDSTRSVMEVREANLARVDKPKELVDRFRVMRVIKSRVFVISLSRPDDVGPAAWVSGGYGYQYDYPVRIISPVFELDGTFKWSERFDPHAIMVEGTRNFLPLFDAIVKTALLPNLHLETPALLFNRRQVDALALLQTGTGELSSE